MQLQHLQLQHLRGVKSGWDSTQPNARSSHNPRLGPLAFQRFAGRSLFCNADQPQWPCQPSPEVRVAALGLIEGIETRPSRSQTRRSYCSVILALSRPRRTGRKTMPSCSPFPSCPGGHRVKPERPLPGRRPRSASACGMHLDARRPGDSASGRSPAKVASCRTPFFYAVEHHSPDRWPWRDGRPCARRNHGDMSYRRPLFQH
jgi:hypothetical protein